MPRSAHLSTACTGASSEITFLKVSRKIKCSVWFKKCYVLHLLTQDEDVLMDAPELGSLHADKSRPFGAQTRSRLISPRCPCSPRSISIPLTCWASGGQSMTKLESLVRFSLQFFLILKLVSRNFRRLLRSVLWTQHHQLG